MTVHLGKVQPVSAILAALAVAKVEIDNLGCRALADEATGRRLLLVGSTTGPSMHSRREIRTLHVVELQARTLPSDRAAPSQPLKPTRLDQLG